MEAVPALNFGSNGTHGAFQREGFQLRNLENQVRTLVNSRPQDSGSGSRDEKLMGVAKQFESLLIHQMLKSMRQTVKHSDLLNSFSLQQYESMLDEQIAEEVAEHKGIGLADMLYNQLRQLDEAANPQGVKNDNLMTPKVNSNE